ncbi:hypothetical protein C2E23DRAFT_863255 [Lenzites betulinus]|nr:hypothetical protein C2E23DRAFT_863255 [Lenzites betulinus]
MPGLQSGSGRGGDKRRRHRGSRTSKSVETAADTETGEEFGTAAVLDRDARGAEVDGVGMRAIAESADRDETDSCPRNEESALKNEMLAAADGEFDLTDANSVDDAAIDAPNALRRDGLESREVRAQRRDKSGTGVDDGGVRGFDGLWGRRGNLSKVNFLLATFGRASGLETFGDGVAFALAVAADDVATGRRGLSGEGDVGAKTGTGCGGSSDSDGSSGLGAELGLELKAVHDVVAGEGILLSAAGDLVGELALKTREWNAEHVQDRDLGQSFSVERTHSDNLDAKTSSAVRLRLEWLSGVHRELQEIPKTKNLRGRGRSRRRSASVDLISLVLGAANADVCLNMAIVVQPVARSSSAKIVRELDGIWVRTIGSASDAEVIVAEEAEGSMLEKEIGSDVIAGKTGDVICPAVAEEARARGTFGGMLTM